MRPAKIRAKITALSHQHPVDTLLDSLFAPVRQRLKLDQNTSMVISSMLDGILIDCVALFLAESREKKWQGDAAGGWGMKTAPAYGWKPGVFRNAVGMLTCWRNR